MFAVIEDGAIVGVRDDDPGDGTACVAIPDGAFLEFLVVGEDGSISEDGDRVRTYLLELVELGVRAVVETYIPIGKSRVYDMKRAEAQAFQSAGTIGPLLQAELTAYATTAAVRATAILAAAGRADSAIEACAAKASAAKAGILAAASPADMRKAFEERWSAA